MNEPHMAVAVERDESGVRIVAPAVGEWSSIPAVGSVVGPGSRIGMLRRLNRRYRLVMPVDVSGRIVDGLPRDRVAAVGFGDTLFRIVPLDVGEDAGVSVGLADDPAAELAAGQRAIVAPTDGVFYRRPSPEAPAYVEAGDAVGLGQTVGLVEVMKTFNQIAYGGAGWPERAEVVEVRVDDGCEVRAGDVLIVVR